MTRLRAGLIGLGMMGRNHARVLASLDEVDLVAVADPCGDLHSAAGGRAVLRDVEELIKAGVDYCVVAAPTAQHLEIGLQLAEAGIHALIEKPLAQDPPAARKLAEAFAERGLVGAVGHVERYNAALQSARRRLENGDLGTVYQIITRRQGPFPGRIADVGVVKDLATHDIDLTAWVSRQPFTSVSARTAFRSGRQHEDLVAVVGSLADGTITNHLVNWLSPLKERVTIMTGERGAFVADTLTADLTFFANGSVPTTWGGLQQFRGVSEGDMIRYAIHKPEPLRLEHENFRDAILGRPADIVTMDQGLTTVVVAEAIIESAATGTTVSFGAFLVRITVVGLGKIGLPLAVQFAEKGHQVTGADVNLAVVDQVNLGQEPFPGEAYLAEKLAAVVATGSLSATTDTAAAVARSEAVVVVVPLFIDADHQPDFGWLQSATADIARGLRPGTLVSYETTLPVGTTRQRWKPQLEEGSGLAEGEDFHLVFSPERVLTGRVFADLRRYPKLIGALSELGAKHASSFYEAVLDFDPRPDLARGNGVWDLGSAEAAEMAKLAETTYRDVNIGLANQFAKFAGQTGIDIYQVIEASNSQPYSHLHQPGIAVGGHCIPVYPWLYLWSDPSATVVRAARAANAGMPAHAVQLAKQAYGDLQGCRVAVLGASYRGGVKETAFSGVFPLVDALRAEGALVSVHDPMYSPGELSALGFESFALGTDVDVVVVQADHAEYATLSLTDVPGAQVIVDGRRVLDASRLAPARIVRIGAG